MGLIIPATGQFLGKETGQDKKKRLIYFFT